MIWKEVKLAGNGETQKEEVMKDVNGWLLLENGDKRQNWANFFLGVI